MVAALLAPGQAAAGQAPDCADGWQPTFGQRPGTEGMVRAFTSFDDGQGLAVYVGSSVASAGANGVARWDGERWSALGAGVVGDVLAMAVHDAGSGAALFVAGELTQAGGAPVSGIARWDGATWSALGTGLDGAVHALASFDDGSGPALYAGGEFTLAGGASALGIARWDGSAWSPVGGGLPTTVRALAVHDDGSGPALFAGGESQQVGPGFTTAVVKWNGTSWSAAGQSLSPDPGAVLTLAVHDVGNGPELYAGCEFFLQQFGILYGKLARWDGATWTEIPTGTPSMGSVRALVSHAGQLHAAGRVLWMQGGSTENILKRWNGAQWTIIWGQDSFEEVRTLGSFDLGQGEELFLGTGFTELLFACTPYDPLQIHRIARYSGSFRALGSGPSAPLRALAVFDDGAGPALFAGGSLRTAGEGCSQGIARWDGAEWTAMGNGLVNGMPMNDPTVHALRVFDDGGGDALFAGGSFRFAMGGAVGRYDGASWSPLGSPNVLVAHALEVYGGALHAGGFGGSWLGRWDGSTWSTLGAGVNGTVLALAEHDDGSGPALFVAGELTEAGGAPASRIARWDGAWSPLGAGLDGTVRALAVFDDGAGPALYVGGDFSTAGGIPAAHVARWSGAAWSAVDGGTDGVVRALRVHDDGTGPALYAGGDFTQAGPVPAQRLARWNGATWSAVGDVGDLTGSVNALASLDDGLVVGGSFAVSPTGDAYLALWRRCDTLGVAYCFGDGSGTACPCGNPSSPGAGCANSSGVGGVLSAAGTASVLADDLLLLAKGLLPGNPAIAFAGRDRVAGGAGMAFGDGLLCAGGPVVRLDIRVPDAGGAAMWGPGLVASGGWLPGSTRRFQVWYRDSTAASCSGFNLTNALEVAFH